MLSGFITGTWNLTDTGPGVGGFCVVPGSHKSSFRIPKRIHEAHQDSPWVKIVEAPAGSLTLFTEALTPRHGPLERRLRAPDVALQILRVQHELGHDPGHTARRHRTHAPASVSFSRDPASR